MMKYNAHNGLEVSAKLVLRVGDAVLMLRRHETGIYNFPGGHVKPGESIQQALRRELNEELAFDLPVEPVLFDIYEHIGLTGPQHIIFHHLLVLVMRPELILGDDEAGSDIQWLRRKGLTAIIPDQEFITKVFAA